MNDWSATFESLIRFCGGRDDIEGEWDGLSGSGACLHLADAGLHGMYEVGRGAEKVLHSVSSFMFRLLL